MATEVPLRSLQLSHQEVGSLALRNRPEALLQQSLPWTLPPAMAEDHPWKLEV